MPLSGQAIRLTSCRLLSFTRLRWVVSGEKWKVRCCNAIFLGIFRTIKQLSVLSRYCAGASGKLHKKSPFCLPLPLKGEKRIFCGSTSCHPSRVFPYSIVFFYWHVIPMGFWILRLNIVSPFQGSSIFDCFFLLICHPYGILDFAVKHRVTLLGFFHFRLFFSINMSSLWDFEFCRCQISCTPPAPKASPRPSPFPWNGEGDSNNFQYNFYL